MFADYFSFLFDDYFFNRSGIRDMTPWVAVEKDGKLYLILNTLGVAPTDIHIDFETGNTYYPQYLKISGKTLNPITGYEHNVNMRIGVRKEISNIDWDAKDGLTTLEISFKEPVKPKISITNKKLLAG